MLVSTVWNNGSDTIDKEPAHGWEGCFLAYADTALPVLSETEHLLLVFSALQC